MNNNQHDLKTISEPEASPSIFKILVAKRFSGLFWTQFLTSFNDNFFKNAIIALINFGTIAADMDSGQRKMLIIFAGLSFIMPYFLFSATAGKIAEESNRIKVVRLIKYLEIAILGLGGVGFMLENIYVMLAMLFLMGVHSTFFSPIKFGILPVYLRKSELIGGNALIETATFLAIIFGTIAGTQMILMPNGGEFYAFVTMLIFAVLGLLTSYKMPQVKNTILGTNISYNLFAHNKEVFGIMRQSPRILKYILAGGWFWFIAAVIMTLLPIYVTDVLKMDKDVYTLMLVLFSVGVGGGSVLCAKLLGGEISARFTPVAALVMGIFIIDIAVASDMLFTHNGLGTLELFLSHGTSWRIMFDFLMIAGAGGLYVVPFFALVQFETNKDEKSRMIAGNNVVNALFMVLGGIYMLITTHIGVDIPSVLLITGGLSFVGAMIVHFCIDDSIFKTMLK